MGNQASEMKDRYSSEAALQSTVYPADQDMRTPVLADHIDGGPTKVSSSYHYRGVAL